MLDGKFHKLHKEAEGSLHRKWYRIAKETSAAQDALYQLWFQQLASKDWDFSFEEKYEMPGTHPFKVVPFKKRK